MLWTVTAVAAERAWRFCRTIHTDLDLALPLPGGGLPLHEQVGSPWPFSAGRRAWRIRRALPAPPHQRPGGDCCLQSAARR